VCPHTTDYDEARLWLQANAALGCEGLVIKDLTGRYARTGRWKYKLKTTVEAIVGGLACTLDSPTSLLLGRRGARGRLRFVGRTGPLTTLQRREVAELAIAVEPGDAHPWPEPLPLPARWSGRLDRPEPVTYVPVQPRLVAEIIADRAYEAGRWRHLLRHLWLRTDLEPADVALWTKDAPPA
jgi:ATP-dependent DNA ligase